MLRARKLAVLLTVLCFVIGACSSEPESSQLAGASSRSESGNAGEPTGPTDTTDTTEAAFDLAAWNQQWSAARQTYLYALQAMNNQLEMLSRAAGATDQQYAMVVVTNARIIADAARDLVAGLAAADPIPVGEVDLHQATDELRAALVAEEKAYRRAAGCGVRVKCLERARAGIVAAARRSGGALLAMPGG